MSAQIDSLSVWGLCPCSLPSNPLWVVLFREVILNCLQNVTHDHRAREMAWACANSNAYAHSCARAGASACAETGSGTCPITFEVWWLTETTGSLCPIGAGRRRSRCSGSTAQFMYYNSFQSDLHWKVCKACGVSQFHMTGVFWHG